MVYILKVNKISISKNASVNSYIFGHIFALIKWLYYLSIPTERRESASLTLVSLPNKLKELGTIIIIYTWIKLPCLAEHIIQMKFKVTKDDWGPSCAAFGSIALFIRCTKRDTHLEGLWNRERFRIINLSPSRRGDHNTSPVGETCARRYKELGKYTLFDYPKRGVKHGGGWRGWLARRWDKSSERYLRVARACYLHPLSLCCFGAEWVRPSVGPRSLSLLCDFSLLLYSNSILCDDEIIMLRLLSLAAGDFRFFVCAASLCAPSHCDGFVEYTCARIYLFVDAHRDARALNPRYAVWRV
jgi:hypothetical protein